MSYLLDTHVILWWLNEDELDATATNVIADPERAIYLSAVSIWEIAIKSALGKLNVGPDTVVAAAEDDFEALPILWKHAAAVADLPTHHRDPFDRLLVAQATVENLTLITRDHKLANYDIDVLVA